jgi:hypothetical protein
MTSCPEHKTEKLDMPENVSIIALPPKYPELNPVENICQFSVLQQAEGGSIMN